ncbi:MAG: septum formation inhibitor Maf [Gallionellaceae bacterium CG_4_9_14_0_8_um_filter_60_335]|nr:MAG: septum formation inhibitor Maf [Gallionellaceae bacterium CG02_land_8_20_14_3_00_60_115]PJC05166.1 MAG: septum formation inhibitor Maf [Gallionellaceae bacterium CG_4_9_14_0_8_um_filter_60_335]
MNRKQIILASTSIYRSQLLATLQIPFLTSAPDVDESPLAGENAQQTSLRLAELKARAVAPCFPRALIIGSDQVALLHGEQLGKPMNHDNAVRQLRAMRGNTVVFHTALSLLDAASDQIQSEVVETRVRFRPLDDAQIERYLHKEQPYHCAGSAKAEGLGIALIERIDSSDPNALIGLPLISLIDMLKKQGIELI